MKCKLCSLITDTFNLTLQCKTDRKCLKCIFIYEIFPHCIFWKVTFYNICIVSKNLGGGDHILFNIIVGASLNMLWYNWKLYYFRLHVYLSFFNSSSINNYHNTERSGTEMEERSREHFPMFGCLILHQRLTERSGTEMEKRSRECILQCSVA
jgi:hypothetical protein